MSTLTRLRIRMSDCFLHIDWFFSLFFFSNSLQRLIHYHWWLLIFYSLRIVDVKTQKVKEEERKKMPEGKNEKESTMSEQIKATIFSSHSLSLFQFYCIQNESGINIKKSLSSFHLHVGGGAGDVNVERWLWQQCDEVEIK